MEEFSFTYEWENKNCTAVAPWNTCPKLFVGFVRYNFLALFPQLSGGAVHWFLKAYLWCFSSGGAKRRRVDSELHIPLQRGWRRDTFISAFTSSGDLNGDVAYTSPCETTFTRMQELLLVSLSFRYFKKHCIFLEDS